MYEIVFTCIAVVFFITSLFDDRGLGITMNVLSLVFFITAGFHFAAFTNYYYYAWICWGCSVINLVFIILRSIELIMVRKAW